MWFMTSISISDDLAERKAAAAASRGVSIDEVATEILTERVAVREALATMAGLVGLGESRESDLSERIGEVIAARFSA